MVRAGPHHTYQTSRLKIMHHVLSFCVTHRWDYPDRPKHMMPGNSGFCPTTAGNPAQPGDLILLGAVPATKFQIGWLERVEGHPVHGNFLVRCLEDNSLGWWGNVSVSYFPREDVQESWHWNDAQHAFAAKWQRTCYKKCKAYIVRPVPAEFTPTAEQPYAVVLRTRTTHSLDSIRCTRSFADWRKMRVADLVEAYQSMVAEREVLKHQIKEPE